MFGKLYLDLPFDLVCTTVEESVVNTCERLSCLSKKLIQKDWANSNSKFVYKKSDLGILLDLHLQFAPEACASILHLLGE